MADAKTRRDNRSTKILYIEDNPENRMLARAVLEGVGYTVSVAEDGLSGIETAIRERPSLILLEVNQRLVDRRLNQVEELKRLNGHFMRRAGQLEDLHRAVQTVTSGLGVTALLEKLLPGVARALGSAGLTVDLAGSGARVTAKSENGDRSRSVLAESGLATDDWSEVEWRLPSRVRDHELGMLVAHRVLARGARRQQ